MKRSTSLLLSALALLLLSPGLAETSFEELVKSLAQKDDQQAVTVSLALEKQEQNSYGLFYNQGLAYRNLGQAARARASFEKALLYSPRDLKTRRRLREVKEKLNPQLAEMDVRGTPWWTEAESQTVLILPGLLLLGLGLRRLFGRSVTPRTTTVAVVFWVFTLVFFWLHNPPPRRAIVVSPNSKLLSQAKSDSSGSALHEGLALEILRDKGHFRQVRLRDGQTGWLRQGQLVEL